MNVFYQVLTAIAPSGGMCSVDGLRHSKEEADAIVDILYENTSVFDTYTIDGKELMFPAFWTQKFIEHQDGTITIELI